MASSSPAQEGPSFAPPPLPAGWIAQWDGVGRKYYFVQLSTGTSQWETPTEAAPTVGTPVASPIVEGQGPYSQPGHEGERAVEGDRSLGSFAMNQLLGSGKHSSNQNSSGLMGIAGSLLSGNSSNSGSQHNSNSGVTSIVGALAGSLLGGSKPNQTHSEQQQSQGNYTGSYGGQQPHHSGLMGKIEGFVGGQHNRPEQNYGYSSSSQSQGGYTGQAPPPSYQPSGTYSQPPSHPQSPQPPYGAGQQTAYIHSSQGQQQNLYAQPPPNQPLNAYSQPPQGQHQPHYGQAQASPSNFGGSPSNHNQGQGGYYSPQPSNYPDNQGQQQQSYGGYGAQQVSGNLQQPHHGHFQGLHNLTHEGGLYGHQGPPPPPPMGSHPHQGYQGGGTGGPPGTSGGYAGSGSGAYGEPHAGGRW
ncbi:MAG: hypothetical protein M1818_003983 [Claussenomyces sp. TS43310]|nr:MAG: hypothetical protein M1818_003983 [Claussenomyces sp. TS43310]